MVLTANLEEYVNIYTDKLIYNGATVLLQVFFACFLGIH